MMSATLPPGPRWSVPHHLGLVLGTYEHIDRLVARYGQVYTVPGLDGPIVMGTTAAAARELYSADPELFDSAAGAALEFALGPGSLLLLGGARHAAERKLLMPPFHGARMRAYGALMAAEALEATAGWAPQTQMNVADVFKVVSLKVIIRAVFGVEGSEQVRAVQDAIVAFQDEGSPLITFFPSLRREFFGRGPWATVQRALRHLNGLLYEIIRARKAEGGGEAREDILSLMIAARYEDGGAMSDDALRDELMTLLFAGHTTTAASLAYAMDVTHRHPEVLARLREELDALGPTPSPEALAQAPWLDAVIKETLRARPLVPTVVRRLRAPFTYQGYDLPAGMGVGLVISRIHRDPQLYPEPDAFKPERFLERRYAAHEYNPFGGGLRRCLGAAFSTYEMKVVLGTLLSRFELRLLDPNPPGYRRAGVITTPRGGVPMAVVRRREPSTLAQELA